MLQKRGWQQYNGNCSWKKKHKLPEPDFRQWGSVKLVFFKIYDFTLLFLLEVTFDIWEIHSCKPRPVEYKNRSWNQYQVKYTKQIAQDFFVFFKKKMVWKVAGIALLMAGNRRLFKMKKLGRNLFFIGITESSNFMLLFVVSCVKASLML